MTEEEQMLISILKVPRVSLYADPPKLLPDQEKILEEMRRRRRQNEPLQYILGECEFMGCPLRVDRRVLIPRPETEMLVENTVNLITQGFLGASLKILDIGTGSGNIAIALAKHLQSPKITAIDISDGAIQLARENARANNVLHLIDFIKMNMTDLLNLYSEKEGRFDVIISNPPYIKSCEMASLPLDVRQEPWNALDAGSDGLYYLRQIIKGSARFLRRGGFLACEIGDDQKTDVEHLILASHYSSYYFLDDLKPVPRFFFAHV